MSAIKRDFIPTADFSTVALAKMNKQSAILRQVLLSGKKITTTSDDATKFNLAAAFIAIPANSGRLYHG